MTSKSVCLALVLLASTNALADDWPSGWGGSRGRGSSTNGAVLLGVTFGLVAAIDLAFVGVDIGLLAASGSYLPPGWAVVQLLLGVGNGLAGLILTPAGALLMALTGSTDGYWLLGSGILLLVIGSWLVGHAIASFLRYRANEPRRERTFAEALTPVVAIASSAQGAQAMLSWRF